MNNRYLVRLIQSLLRNKGSKNSKLVIGGIVLIIGYAYLQPVLESQFGINLPRLPDSAETRTANNSNHRSSSGNTPTVVTSDGEQAILDAFAARQSDLIVQLECTIKKLLPDDLVGSKHQKMILRLSSGHTVMLAHNIDLADRVPADEGDILEIKGEYEYSEQGGVLHWTHHDPRRRRDDGWIKHNGITYK